ncbi:MAG: methyltransferase domain-containing protein, partial [Acidobacteria bacterium]|nr:methyltransferase domain-containing protein [Acidobacteriota bacterium]
MTASSDAEALARRLVDDLAAIQTPPPGASRAVSSAPGGETGEAPRFDLSGALQMLENGARYVSPHLPAEARYKAAKGLLLRALRIVTRDQTVFNSAVAESLRIAVREVESALNATAALSAEAREMARKALEEVDHRSSEGAARHEELIAALTREARAREEGDAAAQAARASLARDLHATQQRLDAVERARDLAAESLERRLERFEEGRAAFENAISRSATSATRSIEAFGEDLRALKLELTALRGELARGPGAGAARLEPAPGGSPPALGAQPEAPPGAYAGVYADFERAFRGSEAEIRRRQEGDVALFTAEGPVADLGCGRGEFLEALAAAGRIGIGCDTNPVMVARSREKGLEVVAADLFSFLESRPDGSLAGITAYQVVEHLPAALLASLVTLATRKLAPGGRVLFETINPESVYAMKWFWMDLTHVRPVPAPSLAQ